MHAHHVSNIQPILALVGQEVSEIKPFDTFVVMPSAMGQVHPLMMMGGVFPCRELVVKTVSDERITVNLYRLQNGERMLDEEGEYPPANLLQMIHMGMFVPQEFFHQFLGMVEPEPEPEPPDNLHTLKPAG